MRGSAAASCTSHAAHKPTTRALKLGSPGPQDSEVSDDFLRGPGSESGPGRGRSADALRRGDTCALFACKT